MRAVYVAAAVFAIVYIALDFNKLYALRYGADLGTYLQTLVNLQHGSSWNYGEWKHHFAVHDSWALTRARSARRALSESTDADRRAGARRRVRGDSAGAARAGARPHGGRAANLLGIAYLLTPAAQGLAYDNFSENVFVPVLAFCGAVAVRRRLVLAGADRRSTADGAQGRSDSLRALVRGGVRVMVGPSHRFRALRAGGDQRGWIFDVRAQPWA